MSLDTRSMWARVGNTWRAVLAVPRTPETERLWADVRGRHPGFVDAVLEDARVAASKRGERYEYRSTLDAVIQAFRLAVVTDAFLALCFYRAKAASQARGIPVLPRILHRLAMIVGQLSIGDPVVLEPGVYVPHGQVVVDGMVTISRGVVLSPFVTIGLRGGAVLGPTIGRRATIGAGATVVGPIRIGNDAEIGANAVVLVDVPDGATAVGVPARVL